jgi:L-lactate dehydrogenase complex protein LldF
VSASPLGYGERSRALLEDEPGVREAVTAATLSFDAHRVRGYGEIDAEAWRRWAEGVKRHGLTRLDECLEEAEARLSERGAVVHWAETAEDARRIVADLLTDPSARRVVKGKSMLSEELRLNPLLEDLGIEVFETDLGECVIQLLDEPPSHILGPAIHRSLEDIRRLFADRFGTAPDASPEALAARAREVLRDAFLSADVGITGGNFLVAETGSLVLMENEGNIRITTSLPRRHVALVGIEKVLPHWSDVAGFVQLTARAATGQPVSVYVSALQGPRGPGEPDGPEELHVVLVDNGRTRLLADPEAWEALRCVRCGACLNACPVFRQTGGHAYGWAYSGPIGAVLAPAYLGLEEAWTLPYASTLCGACTEVCPVRIPLADLLHTWRVRAVEAELVPRSERLGVAAYAALASRPGLFHAAGEALRALPVLGASRRLPVVGPWVRERGPLEPSPVPFERDPEGEVR